MIRFKNLLGITFSFLWSCVMAQEAALSADSTTVLVSVNAHFGSILPHSSSIAQLSNSRVKGFQFDLSRIRYTERSWNACNCFSENGISLSYFDFGSPEVLGQALSLALFAEPQLTHGRLNVALRAGAGISYLTRVFDPDRNPANLFFSVPWSGLLLAQLSCRYRLSRRWLVRGGFSYHHISNGGQRQPNMGMNFPTADVGVAYALDYFPPQKRQKTRLIDRSLRYYVGLFYNTRAVDESDFATDDREPVLGVHAGVYKPVAPMHAVGVGGEFSHDRALRKRALLNDAQYGHHVLSALIRHHLIFGRFDFSQALGIYVVKDYPTPSRVFQRYALTYRFWKSVHIGFSLKAHLHTAEQMDVRVGIGL